MVLALGPVGCGFQPIYARPGGAPSSPVAEQLASVRVAAIGDRSGQKLRNSLVLALSPAGEPASPRYKLDIQLNEGQQALAESKDGTATVGRINATAYYTLTDMQTGAVVHSGQARAFSGYRYLGPRYASTASERESQTSAVSEIAAEIRGALSAYFTNPATFARRQAKSRQSPLFPPRPDTPLGEAE